MRASLLCQYATNRDRPQRFAMYYGRSLPFDLLLMNSMVCLTNKCSGGCRFVQQSIHIAISFEMLGTLSPERSESYLLQF